MCSSDLAALFAEFEKFRIRHGGEGRGSRQQRGQNAEKSQKFLHGCAPRFVWWRVSPAEGVPVALPCPLFVCFAVPLFLVPVLMPGRQGAEIAHDQHQKAHGEEGDAAVQGLLIRHVQKDQLDQRERQ